MHTLHGGNHAEVCEADDVVRVDVLGVLDAVPPISRAKLTFEILVEIQKNADRTVTDGVNGHLQPGLLRLRDLTPQILERSDEQSGVVRFVRVRLLEQRAPIRVRRLGHLDYPAGADLNSAGSGGG